MNILHKINKKNIIVVSSFSWMTLGYYRGTQHYNFNYNLKLEEYNKDMERYNNELKEYNKKLEKYLYVLPPSVPKKPNKFYLTSMANGLYGLLFYSAPIPGIFYFFKEIYRAEVYLRNMDDEKKNKYFNTLDL